MHEENGFLVNDTEADALLSDHGWVPGFAGGGVSNWAKEIPGEPGWSWCLSALSGGTPRTRATPCTVCYMAPDSTVGESRDYPSLAAAVLAVEVAREPETVRVEHAGQVWEVEFPIPRLALITGDDYADVAVSPAPPDRDLPAGHPESYTEIWWSVVNAAEAARPVLTFRQALEILDSRWRARLAARKEK